MLKLCCNCLVLMMAFVVSSWRMEKNYNGEWVVFGEVKGCEDDGPRRVILA